MPEQGHGDPKNAGGLFRPAGLAGAVLWTIMIGVLSLLPTQKLPPIPPFPGADKIFHAAFYAVLGLLWIYSLVKRTGRMAFILGLLLSVYGLALEIGQRHVPGRSYDLLDAAANAAGVIVGIMILFYLHPVRRA